MDEDTAIYNLIKDSPDFECLPLPSHWYEKFNIPPRKTLSTREFIESEYTLKMAMKPKNLPPIIINEPQQGGKLVVVPETAEIPVEVITRPFEVKEGEAFPVILPSLMDETASQQVR
jgi:hypothetical protein